VGRHCGGWGWEGVGVRSDCEDKMSKAVLGGGGRA
jgi:hypothetical protein